MQVLKVSEKQYLVLLDTEGLRAPEIMSTTKCDSIMHDNVMAATVIGISDLSLVNMMKLFSAPIAEILEIVAESFIKFRQMMALEHPGLCFVHQDVREIDNGENVNQEA
jgi:hypothetical protein